MKKQEIDKYYHYHPNNVLIIFSILFVSFLLFYWIGLIKFNHNNIKKAYLIIDEYIKGGIRSAEKQSISQGNEQNASN
jgi:hypothetical protein